MNHLTSLSAIVDPVKFVDKIDYDVSIDLMGNKNNQDESNSYEFESFLSLNHNNRQKSNFGEVCLNKGGWDYFDRGKSNSQNYLRNHEKVHSSTSGVPTNTQNLRSLPKRMKKSHTEKIFTIPNQDIYCVMNDDFEKLPSISNNYQSANRNVNQRQSKNASIHKCSPDAKYGSNSPIRNQLIADALKRKKKRIRDNPSTISDIPNFPSSTNSKIRTVTKNKNIDTLPPTLNSQTTDSRRMYYQSLQNSERYNIQNYQKNITQLQKKLDSIRKENNDDSECLSNSFSPSKYSKYGGYLSTQRFSTPDVRHLNRHNLAKKNRLVLNQNCSQSLLIKSKEAADSLEKLIKIRLQTPSLGSYSKIVRKMRNQWLKRKMNLKKKVNPDAFLDKTERRNSSLEKRINHILQPFKKREAQNIELPNNTSLPQIETSFDQQARIDSDKSECNLSVISFSKPTSNTNKSPNLAKNSILRIYRNNCMIKQKIRPMKKLMRKGTPNKQSMIKISIQKELQRLKKE